MAKRSRVEKGHQAFALPFPSSSSPPWEERRPKQIVVMSRQIAYETLNTLILQRNRPIGKRIYEEELKGENRAEFQQYRFDAFNHCLLDIAFCRSLRQSGQLKNIWILDQILGKFPLHGGEMLPKVCQFRRIIGLSLIEAEIDLVIKDHFVPTIFNTFFRIPSPFVWIRNPLYENRIMGPRQFCRCRWQI